jgi:ABC-type multidrug transport system ATPase subunit
MQLTIAGLSKRYANGVQALDDVSLTLAPGMFGLLGENGAGKSTLMRILATLQDADAGSVRLGDVDVCAQKDEVRKQLGYLPQEFGLYPRVSAVDLLDHLALLKGVRDKQKRKTVVDALLTRTNLWDARHRNLGTYSGGMKQRFGIAQALIGEPRLIIVDDPTAGLDPEERNRFHNLLAEIGKDVIVILSTHIVGDVSDLCQQMAILHKGKVKVTGAPNDLVARVRGSIWRKSVDGSELANLETEHTVISTRQVAGKVNVHVHAAAAPAGFESVEPDLEDVYFTAMKVGFAS